MAWTANLEVKGIGGTSAASQALTLTTAPAAGDFIVLLYEAFHAAGPPTSATITDNKGGNTWVQDTFGSDPVPNRSVGIWHTTVVNGGAGFQVTVTPNTTAENNLVLHRYASPGGTVSLDSAAHNHAETSTAITSGALTVTGSGPDLAVAIAGDGVADLNSAGTGFTLQADITTGSTDYFSSEDQLGVTAGLTPNFPFTTSGWICAAAAYKYGSSGPTTATISAASTSGLVGAVSGTFTVTLNSAAQTGGVSCPITSSVGGDTVTTSPVVIASGQTTGTFTITPSTVGSRNVTLGTTTPSLTISGSPIAYNSLYCALTLDNTSPPSNRTIGSTLSFTNQQLLLGLSRGNFLASTFRSDGLDLQVYASDGVTTIPTYQRSWGSSVGLRFMSRIAVPTGNSPSYGPYVQCEAAVCGNIGLTNDPHTAYGYATQANVAGNTLSGVGGQQQGGMVVLDKTGATAFTFGFSSGQNYDSVNSLNIGDVNGDGIPEILVGSSRGAQEVAVITGGTTGTVLWTYPWTYGAANANYIRNATVGKVRHELPGNEVFVTGGTGLANGYVDLVNHLGVKVWGYIATTTKVNGSTQNSLIADLSNSGQAACFFSRSNEIWKLDYTGALVWTYAYDSAATVERNFYGLASGFVTTNHASGTQQIVAAGGYPAGTVSDGVIICVNDSGALLWEKVFPMNAYGVQCADLNGDGYDEVIVMWGTDTGANSPAPGFCPPDQGWGGITILDLHGDEITTASLPCAVKATAYGNFDGSGQKQIQVCGDDGYLYRFGIDLTGASIKCVVPSVTSNTTSTLYLGSSGGANLATNGDFSFNLTGANGTAPIGFTAELGTWTMQSGRIQSPSDGDTATHACLDAAYVSVASFELQGSAWKINQGTGAASDYYNCIYYKVSSYSGGIPVNGYKVGITCKASTTNCSLGRYNSGTNTPVVVVTAPFTLNTTDQLDFRIVCANDWHSCIIRKNGGAWTELWNIQDSSPITASGSVAYCSERGQSQFSALTIYGYSNTDVNAGPGPVPLLYAGPLAPTTATLSGPSSGTTGVASSAFAITLDHAALVSESFPITYSGGTVTTSPVVIGVGMIDGSFTVTPSGTGATNVVLGAGTTGLTVAGTPISYTASAGQTYYPTAMMLGL